MPFFELQALAALEAAAASSEAAAAEAAASAAAASGAPAPLGCSLALAVVQECSCGLVASDPASSQPVAEPVVEPVGRPPVAEPVVGKVQVAGPAAFGEVRARTSAAVAVPAVCN